MGFDPDRFITDRLRAIDASGIRRVFDLAATLENPVDLSIGQPHFDVPDAVKRAAIDAIESGLNRYTVTQGDRALSEAVCAALAGEFPQHGPALNDGTLKVLVTSGVSGGLVLALLTCAGPGDEVLMPDPYFVMYSHLVRLAGAVPVFVDTYPDFQMTAQRIEPHLSERSKLILFNSPSNPTGAVTTAQVCREVADFARQHDLLLVSDEIYDEFCYEKVQRPPGGGERRCPSPVEFSQDVLLLRGFSKTYAMTGWRLGHATGPAAIIDQMTKLQQYTFVCAPSMAQAAGVVALGQDVSARVDEYERKRDRVVERLGGAYELTRPGGAFYAFPRVPEHLGLTGTQFVEKAIERGLLIIPGSVFSERDTHFRLSYACDEAMLEKGLDLLVELAG